MEIRKFQVRDVRDGLRRIKSELGDDAVILQTTREGDGRLEITVGIDRSASPTRPHEEPARDETPPAGNVPDAMMALVRELSDQIRSLRHEVVSLRRDRDEILDEVRSVSQSAVGARERPRLDGDALSALRLGIARLTDERREETFARTISLVYQSLIAGGMLAEHVEELVAHAFASDAGWEERPAMLHDLVRSQIEQRVRVCDPIWCTRPGKTEVVALVGSTGVGKTTTTAKLAAHASRVAHKKVAIICADAFRIGASEQIEHYANLLRVPSEFASKWSELQQAIERLSREHDLILVDTAGRNPFRATPRDSLALNRLHELSPEHFETSIHLCLSAPNRAEELLAMIDGFGPMRPSALIFTKLDEARGLGGLFSAAHESELQISHVCDGPMVPNDVGAPTSREIATWLSRGVERRNMH